jgi:hypothetical protein
MPSANYFFKKLWKAARETTLKQMVLKKHGLTHQTRDRIPCHTCRRLDDELRDSLRRENEIRKKLGKELRSE